MTLFFETHRHIGHIVCLLKIFKTYVDYVPIVFQKQVLCLVVALPL